MKYLQSFEEFEEQNTNPDESKFLKKQDVVIGRDFFRELKVKIRYWFKFGRMSKKQEDHKGRKIHFVLQDIEQIETDITFWFSYFINDTITYEFKVCYKLNKPDAEIESLSELAAYFYCYDNEEINILKEMDQKISVKDDLKEKVFLQTIKDIVKTILEEPKDDKEANTVGDSEDLMDNIY